MAGPAPAHLDETASATPAAGSPPGQRRTAALSAAPAVRRQIRVTGTVQGVGFRPFVYRQAVALALRGWVRNDPAGVLIDVEGPSEAVDQLCRLLVEAPPPLARVESVTASALPLSGAAAGFRIAVSDAAGEAAVPVSVDTATCADCLAEMADPSQRRHRYPFTNCTNCGPRYTIVTRVPYDRPFTTMTGFPMCADCRREYEDPGDRRFHAQPIACPVCGPKLVWRRPDGTGTCDGEEALQAAVTALRGGAIVAVKGLGGYHLAVDAANEASVAELRRRKARDDKPFAVMVAGPDQAETLCRLDDTARRLLASPRRPIVLLPRRPDAPVAASVAPGAPELGLLLAYTPLHHLLLTEVGCPLVMTSGNRSDDPIAHEDDDALERLGPLVDGLLGHDRPIHIRCDDSVVRVSDRRVQVLRRSRGFAPEPMALPAPARRPVLAVGAELKSTVAVARGTIVVASHHIGDLEHLGSYRSFLQAVGHLPALLDVVPAVVAHDLHPEYLSTKWAVDQALARGVDAVAVQHHHAHVASLLVEHGQVGPVLGIAFDGLGFGADGTLWGGELLAADLHGFRRLAHLRCVPMPGGAAAIREPWRMALVWAMQVGGPELASRLGPTLDERWRQVLALAGSARAPTTSSVGRLFDAMAALLGGRHHVHYEGQAAIELEALARSGRPVPMPGFDIGGHDSQGAQVADPGPLVAAALAARDAGMPAADIAAGFHAAFGAATARLAAELAEAEGLDTVGITGGVFQNTLLTDVVESALLASGLRVLVHHQVPPNDGGISVGQAAVAALASGSGDG